MEARKRFMYFDMTKLSNPPMPNYTFSIYNRDLFEKSKFKNYDSLLKSRFARDQARANHLAWILVNGNMIGTNETLTRTHGRHENKRDGEEVLAKTDTYATGKGEYVASFTLGYQKIKSFLIIDTGSDLTWWQCGPCVPNGCYEQVNDPLYVEIDNHSFGRINCTAEPQYCDTSRRNFICDPRERGDTCSYDYTYEDGGRTKGWLASDTITFDLDGVFTWIIFGCGKDQTSGTPFDGAYSGLVGLGRRVMQGRGYSLPSQFGADIMAICLPTIASTEPSTITFFETPFTTEISAGLVPNSRFPFFYYVNFYKIFINDQEVPFDPSYWNFRDDLSGGCMVDTGTTISRFPRVYYNLFRDIFRQQVRDFPRYEGPLSGPYDTCYTVADLSQEPIFPVVKMYFGTQNPNNLLLLSQHRVVVPTGAGNGIATLCLAFLPWDESDAIIGSYQLQGIGLTFDTAANTLSFNLDACQ
ncbi:unnamed protein product [Withania somnifera]